MRLAISFYRSCKIKRLLYKRIPQIYEIAPAQEDLYALFVLDAKLVRRDLGSVVALQSAVRYSKGRKWSVKKAGKHNFCLEEGEDIRPFWVLLSETLQLRHGVSPVHTIEEIAMLRFRFPKNIRFFIVRNEKKELLAGTLIFETATVAHAQYIANSVEGRKVFALDLLLNWLIKEVYREKRYFSFGTSTEEEGRCINSGLISQKEGFGARGVVNDFYEINLDVSQ